jgi:pilus assembly protein CpaC
MNLFKILFSILAIITIGFSSDLVQKNLNDKSFSINKGSFKIVEFDKMITNIKVSDENFIELDFVEDNAKPLQAVKIFAKEMGHGNILVTFVDSSSMLIDINIIENISDIINIAKQLSPTLQIKQINGKLLLDGFVENQKIKDSIISLLKKADIDIKDQVIDLSTVKNPDKMIRIKLYVVEIDNNKSEEITNNWSVLGFNDGKTSADFAIDSTTSVSGGLSAIANRIGSKFNVGFALNYLKSNDIAKILDETTLITLENNESKFHSGGTINARTSTTDSVQFTQISYGLKMKINVQQIIDGKYIKLLINTESSTIDDELARVDDIPAIKNKTIDTNVIVANLSTIILGGLINIGNKNYEEKIPLLGDIPLLGKIFTSSAESTDNKELVFFITPEIVDPKDNNQINTFEEKSAFKKDLILENNTKTNKDEEIQKVETKKDEVEEKIKETEHQKRVKEILGY